MHNETVDARGTAAKIDHHIGYLPDVGAVGANQRQPRQPRDIYDAFIHDGSVSEGSHRRWESSAWPCERGDDDELPPPEEIASDLIGELQIAMEELVLVQAALGDNENTDIG